MSLRNCSGCGEPIQGHKGLSGRFCVARMADGESKTTDTEPESTASEDSTASTANTEGKELKHRNRKSRTTAKPGVQTQIDAITDQLNLLTNQLGSSRARNSQKEHSAKTGYNLGIRYNKSLQC
ncbi:uncharacterized protein LOC144442839 isoform X2 [Glandiceps talaboti]